MDHAWLDSLSEDWVSQPRSGSPAQELPSFSNSVSESNSHIASSRIPKYNPQKQAWTAQDGGNSPLSERSLNNHNIPLSQRGTLRNPTKVRQVTNGTGRGRRISRTLSASSTQSVQHHTVQHKSHSLSPKKGPQDTPEWKRRLLHGDVAYGEQRDLFSPAGLESLFKPPPPPPEATSPRKSPMRFAEEVSVMPSSPPPYNARRTSEDEEDEEDEEEEGEEEEGSLQVTKEERNQPRGMKYRLAKTGSGTWSANNLSRSSSFQAARTSSQNMNRQAQDSETGEDCNSSFAQHDAGGSEPGRIISGQSVIRNEELSPIYVARHNTIDGRIDYAALPADELQRRLENVWEESPMKSIGDQENQQNSSECMQPDETAGTDDFARKGEFINLRRGGRSEEGSFQNRMLSPSSLPAIDESMMLSEASMQASTPKALPNITKMRASAEFRISQPSNLQPSVPPAPHPSPVKFLAQKSKATSGSPLKLFGTYDTFTNQKLLRRLSQFEGALDDDDEKESSAVSGHESTHPSLNDAFVAASSPEKVSQRSHTHGHNSKKVNSFGEGDLDNFEFSEELSYNSISTNSYEHDKENEALPILNPRTQTSFKFELDPSALESEVVVRRRAKYTTTTSTSKFIVSSREQVRPGIGGSDISAQLPDSQIQEDLQTPRRRNGDSEGKRLLNSPLKDPTPKRRRTLQRTEIQRLAEDHGEYEVDSLNETHQQMQSVIGRKRKDARHGDDQQAANPKVLAMRQILRPRTPTPSQRSSQNQERQPLQEIEVADVEREKLAQDKKIARIQAELDATDPFRVSAFGSSQPMVNDSRKGSVTTQDFLDEAKKIMAGIRNKTKPRSGLTSVEESDSDNDKIRAAEVTSPELDLDDTYESTQEPFSRPPSREGGAVLPRLPKNQEDPVLLDHLRKYQEKSDLDGVVASSLRSIAMAKEAANAARETDRMIDETISRSSARMSRLPNREDTIQSDPPNIRISQNPEANRKRKHSTSSAPSGSGTLQEDDFPSQGSNGSSNQASSRSIPTGSSRGSDSRRVILPNTVSHLIPEQLAGMVFDRERNIWVKRKIVSDESTSLNFSPSDETEDDPFGDIPDLSVDETQELQRIKAVAAKREEEAREQDEDQQQIQADNRPAGNSEPSVGSKSTAPHSLDRSNFNHKPTNPETRNNLLPQEVISPIKSASKSVHERVESRYTETREEIIEEVEREISILEDRVSTPPRRRNVTISFSSPLASIIQTKYQDEQSFEQQDADESEQSDDGDQNGGTVNRKASNYQQTPSGKPRKQFRSASRNLSLGGHKFSVRPVSRIDEQDEESALDNDDDRFRRSVSIVVTAPASPRQSSVVLSTPRPTRQAGTLDLTPLSEFTIHQSDESLGLDVSYVEQNQRHSVGLRGQRTLSLSIKDLVEKITEVEPYEPFWEHLKQMELNDKRLTNLHKLDEFCEQLEELDVSRNQIGHLDGVPRTVRHLNISHNRLSDLTSWGHLINLQYVDVSNNDLDSLSALRNLVHMRSLRADNNKISSLHGIDHLDGLLSLRMRNNSVRELDFRGTKLQRLTDLDVQGNLISRVDGLHDLRSLSVLNLIDNQLSEWTVLKTEELPAMKYLKLSGNNLESIDVSQYPNLRLLYLDGNRLGKVIGLYRTKYLDSLSMREQQQDSIIDPGFLSETYEVRKLFLSGNLLKTFEPKHNFLNLQYLELASCGIETLPSSFGSMMANIRVLNLNSNAMREISPLVGIVRLKKLYLAGNRLDELKGLSEIFSNFISLSIADLRGNPLTVGFYPPIMESRVVVLGEPEEETVVDEPFTLAKADKTKDERYQSCLDMDTRIQRRLYDMFILFHCKRLKQLDGLPTDRHGSMERRDKVYAKMVERGHVLAPEGGEQEEDVPEPKSEPVKPKVVEVGWPGEDSFAQ